MKILSDLTARNMSNINNFLIREFNEKKKTYLQRHLQNQLKQSLTHCSGQHRS